MMYARVEDYETQHRERPSAAFDVIDAAVSSLGVQFKGLEGRRLVFQRDDRSADPKKLGQQVSEALKEVVTKWPSLREALQGVEAIAIR